jgi:uncharacterized protein YbaR (Trm112 family)
MFDANFLAMLRCPEDHSKLSLADTALVSRLNAAVSAGRLKSRGGQKLEKQLDGALIRADGRVIYPIVDQIPILLVDEAISAQDNY